MASFKERLKLLKARPKKPLGTPVAAPPAEETEEDRTRALLEARGPSVMSRAAAAEIPCPSSSGGVAATTSGYRGCVALLFMTRSTLPHEQLWRRWIRALREDQGLRVVVWAHAHHPEQACLSYRHLSVLKPPAV